MKKIAIIVDIKIDSGGALGMCLTIINYIKKTGLQNFNIITTYKSTSDFLFKNHKINNFYFNKNFILNRIINLLFKLKFCT